MTNRNLEGSTTLITGAGRPRGLGFAIARKLAACGSSIILSDIETATSAPPISLDSMNQLAGQLAEEFEIEARAVVLDVTDHPSITRLTSQLVSEFKTIEILVNNAGVALGVPSDVRNYDESAWLRTFDINLHGAFRLSKAIIPLMKNGGAIVNMASRAGKVPPIWNGAYAASKAGLIMLTKVMALELANLDIRVNAVCPGLIKSDFQDFRLELEAQFYNSTPEAREAALSANVAQNRFGTADEVADLVAFLVSSESSYLTGQAINVCGGLTMEL